MILQIYTSGATNIFKYPELSDRRESKSADQHLRAEREAQRADR